MLFGVTGKHHLWLMNMTGQFTSNQASLAILMTLNIMDPLNQFKQGGLENLDLLIGPLDLEVQAPPTVAMQLMVIPFF